MIVFHESATFVKLFPTPLSNLGGWPPDSHSAVGSIALEYASRACSSVHYSRSTMFRRHAALLVARRKQRKSTVVVYPAVIVVIELQLTSFSITVPVISRSSCDDDDRISFRYGCKFHNP